MTELPATFAGRVGLSLEESPTIGGIPLIGLDQLDLKDAQTAALISVLADIIEATCVLPAAVPTTHATAA